ncbi:MAG: LamG-like jellyroll fold domain-containing protein [Chitinophagaceae bacterium]
MKQILLLVITFITVLHSNAQAPTTGLVSYYPFDGNFVNSISTSLNGTGYGSPTATTNIGGTTNSAIAFNGTANQYALHPTNSTINFGSSQNFTVSFSCYLNSTVNQGFYDNHLNYGGYGVWFWRNSFNQFNFNFRNGNIGTTSATTVSTSTWYHVTAVRDNGTLKLYLNGVLNNSGAEGTATPTYPYQGCLGGMYFNSNIPPVYNPLNGKLDELRIYNRALTATEIAQLSTFALAAKLKSFTASFFNNTTSLSWQVSHAENIKTYSVERSINGVEFSEIGTINSNSVNTGDAVTYNFKDVLQSSIQTADRLYYRLKFINTEGTYSYSNTLMVIAKRSDFTINISPNPVKNIVQIQTDKSMTGEVEIVIFNNSGIELLKRTFNLQNGSNVISLNISNLPTALYNLQVKNKNIAMTKQLLKE